MLNKEYWRINENTPQIVNSHIKLINCRNKDDSYGKTSCFDSRIILTYNVIELFVEEGLPFDSPRLEKSLIWIKSNAIRAKNLTVGRIFRLLSSKFFEKDAKFYDDLKSIKAIILSDNHKIDEQLEYIPYFPLLALDILYSDDKTDFKCVNRLLKYTNDNFYYFEKQINSLSYIALLSFKFSHNNRLKKNCELLLTKSLKALSTKIRQEQSIIKKGYTLYNLGKLPKAILTEYNLTQNIELIKDELFNFLRRRNTHINSNELPMEIIQANNAEEIYPKTVIMRGLISTLNIEDFRLNFAHTHLKLLYEKFYYPLKKKYFLYKWLVVPSLLILLLFAFMLANKFTGILSTSGSLASVLSLILYIIIIKLRNGKEKI